MKLLVDNNLPPRLARALDQIVAPDGGRAVALRDKFEACMADVDWIGHLSREGGWAVLSDDHRIKKNHAERQAWRQGGLVGFFLAPAYRKMDIYEKTARIIWAWPQMSQQFSLVTGSALFDLQLNRKLKALPL